MFKLPRLLKARLNLRLKTEIEQAYLTWIKKKTSIDLNTKNYSTPLSSFQIAEYEWTNVNTMKKRPWNNLDTVEMLVEMEKNLNLDVPLDAEFLSIQTFQDILNWTHRGSVVLDRKSSDR